MNTKFTEKCSWDKKCRSRVTQIKFLFCLSSRLILASYDASRVSHPLDYSLPLTRYTNAQLMCKYYLLMDRTNKDFHVVQGLLQKQRKFLFPVSNFCNWFPLRNLEWRKMMKCFKKQEWKVFCTGLASLSFSLADFHQAS